MIESTAQTLQFCAQPRFCVGLGPLPAPRNYCALLNWRQAGEHSESLASSHGLHGAGNTQGCLFAWAPWLSRFKFIFQSIDSQLMECTADKRP